jgi:hypothetical protein
MDERDQTTANTSLSDEEEDVRQLLATAGPRPPIPQEDLDAIAAAARGAWQNEVRRRGGIPGRPPGRPVRALVLGLAAALALSVGLAWWLLSRTTLVRSATIAQVEAVAGPVHLEAEAGASRPIAARERVALGAVLQSGGGGRASLRLLDGATVRLDVETRLRFAAADVLELERGAIYIDTEDAASSPRAIEVRTPLGTVRDVGTQFAVRVVAPERETLLVRVRDGEVFTEQRGRTYVTAAGQELVLRRDGKLEQREIAPYGSDWDWVMAASPGFDIEGRSLREFLDWVSRETGWRVVLADEELADSAETIVLHGSLGRLRPDQAPFAVLPGAGLDGELENGRLVVRRR